MNRVQTSRRRFLKAVGATALTYPFLRALPSFAQADADPQYLILIFTPVGVVRYLWGALGPARGSSSAVTSALSGSAGAGAFRSTLQPFASTPATAVLPASASDLTSKTIVLDGLNVGTAFGSHEAGMATLWTGQLVSGNPATSPSIDQAIAYGVSPVGFGRPYPTIQLQVQSSADFSSRDVLTRMLYSTAGGFVDPNPDPVSARSSIFNIPTTAPDAGPNPQGFIRKQLFAQLNSELSSLQTRLCTDDARQLQNLQDQWNDLDTQLAQAAQAAASCNDPGPAPAGYAAPSIDFPTSAKLQMDILTLALQCDLTRVASIQFSTATSQVTHSWLGSNQTDIHHDYSHDGPTSLYSLCPYGSTGDLYDIGAYQPSVSTYPIYAAAAQMGTGQLPAIDYWYAQQIAYLANRLNGLTTVTGKNLLDQSVICWGTELDMGAYHNHDDTPFVLIGSCGGKLKTGQLVQFPLNLANGLANLPPTNNRFHNDLLITLAQVMGLNLTTFGTASGAYKGGASVNYCTGPIREILV